MSTRSPIKNHMLQRWAFGTVLLCLMATAVCADVGEELHKLTASDAGRFRVFGSSVGISGDIAIVGAPGAGDGVVPTPGSAYLINTATGQEIHRLTSSDAEPADDFGFAVGISGSRAIVGAYQMNSAAGFAYLFDTTTGEELFKLTASAAMSNDLFGWSVAIDEDRAIVGAPTSGESPGSAYVFDVRTGQELFKLASSDPAVGEFFGWSVAISGNTAIVGSLADVVDGGVVNSVYLFDVTTGQELLKITGPNPAELHFGASVAISDNIAMVGSADVDAHDGAAYLFDVTTGQVLYKLTASDAGNYDLFGDAVAVSGNTAIVGAEYDAADQIRFGSAYLFDVSTGRQLAKVTASDAAANAAFGSSAFGASVAIDGNLAIIGAPETRGFTGAAYIVEAVPEPASMALLGLALLLSVPRTLHQLQIRRRNVL